MDDAEELYDDLGLNNVKYNTHEDYVALEIDANAKIAESYGGLCNVYVGDLLGRREVYKELCLYATIHFHSQSANDCVPQQIEGHIKCSTILELATVARGLSMGKILVIDKETKEILESRTW